jgi:hypothetical protein
MWGEIKRKAVFGIDRLGLRKSIAKPHLRNCRLRNSEGEVANHLGCRCLDGTACCWSCAFRSALLHQQQSDTLQKFGGSIHSLGEENIRLRILFIDLDLP